MLDERSEANKGLLVGREHRHSFDTSRSNGTSCRLLGLVVRTSAWLEDASLEKAEPHLNLASANYETMVRSTNSYSSAAKLKANNSKV